jgi:cytochrome c oxidase subunit 4
MSAHAHAHNPSPRIYLIILGLLLVLTGVTVGAAYVNFGSFNLIIAVLIATVKATLVALFFMHLRHDPPINAIIFVSSLIFLGLFLLFPLIDIQSRDKVVPYGLRMQAQPAAQKQAPAAGTPSAPPAAAEHAPAH